MTPQVHATRKIPATNFAQIFTGLHQVRFHPFLARVRVHVRLEFAVAFEAFITQSTRKRQQLVATHVFALVTAQFFLGVKYFVARATRMRLVRERKATPVVTQTAR